MTSRRGNYQSLYLQYLEASRGNQSKQSLAKKTLRPGKQMVSSLSPRRRLLQQHSLGQRMVISRKGSKKSKIPWLLMIRFLRVILRMRSIVSSYPRKSRITQALIKLQSLSTTRTTLSTAEDPSPEATGGTPEYLQPFLRRDFHLQL